MAASADRHHHWRDPIAALLASAAALGVAGVAGCGNGQSGRSARSPDSGAVSTAPAPRSRTLTTSSRRRPSSSAPRGRILVTFKRAVGVDPLASYFTLYSSGQGIATVVYGGRDGARVHSFDLGDDELRGLRRLLRHTRLHDATIQNPNLYTYWVITDHGSHRLQQGTVPRSARPLLGKLTAIAEANHLF